MGLILKEGSIIIKQNAIMGNFIQNNFTMREGSKIMNFMDKVNNILIVMNLLEPMKKEGNFLVN